MMGSGKLCGISSLSSSVRFQGPLLCQTSRSLVASFGSPYCFTNFCARPLGCCFQPAVRVSNETFCIQSPPECRRVSGSTPVLLHLDIGEQSIQPFRHRRVSV